MMNKANMADRDVIVYWKTIDSMHTEFTTQRHNVIITDSYVGIILRNSDNSINKEIIRPWHQIKELTITEVKNNEEPGNSADTR